MSKDKLLEALVEWEKNSRVAEDNGAAMTREQVRAMPAEQVGLNNLNYLLKLMKE